MNEVLCTNYFIQVLLRGVYWYYVKIIYDDLRFFSTSADATSCVSEEVAINVFYKHVARHHERYDFSKYRIIEVQRAVIGGIKEISEIS